MFWDWFFAFAGRFFSDWLAVIKIAGLMTVIGFALEQLKPVGQRLPIAAMFFNIAYVAFSFAMVVTLVPWLQEFTHPIVQRWAVCCTYSLPMVCLAASSALSCFC